MSDTDLINKLKEIAGDGNVLCDEPMSKHTTFKAGGAARFFVTIPHEESLKSMVPYL